MYTFLLIYTATFMHLCARSQTDAICDPFGRPCEQIRADTKQHGAHMFLQASLESMEALDGVGLLEPVI
jgi:hypothetical protein